MPKLELANGIEYDLPRSSGPCKGAHKNGCTFDAIYTLPVEGHTDM